MKRDVPAAAIGALNTAAFAAYLIWLARYGQGRLFQTQEGILFLLPVLPIFIVYILLAHGRGGGRGGGETPDP